MDVGVGEGGKDAAPAKVDGVRSRERPFVDADPARDALARHRHCPCLGSDSSIVRMTPFSRITAASLARTEPPYLAMPRIRTVYAAQWAGGLSASSR